jgi:hypothetical protein
LVSSQLPVGTTRRLEQAYAADYGQLRKPVTFGYSPENLRLGKAIDVFTQPDRVVVGLRVEADRTRVEKLLRPFTDRIEWMSVESAEMTKHALNAFLATSIVFINEVAALCEEVGADAKEVERGLKSEVRIGPKAYLAPGGAFAGAHWREHYVPTRSWNGASYAYLLITAVHAVMMRIRIGRVANCSAVRRSTESRLPYGDSPTNQTPVPCVVQVRSSCVCGWLHKERRCKLTIRR